MAQTMMVTKEPLKSKQVNSGVVLYNVKTHKLSNGPKNGGKTSIAKNCVFSAKLMWWEDERAFLHRPKFSFLNFSFLFWHSSFQMCRCFNYWFQIVYFDRTNQRKVWNILALSFTHTERRICQQNSCFGVKLSIPNYFYHKLVLWRKLSCGHLSRSVETKAQNSHPVNPPPFNMLRERMRVGQQGGGHSSQHDNMLRLSHGKNTVWRSS